MANTDIATFVGTMGLDGVDVLGGTGTVVTGDSTTEFTRKLNFMVGEGDMTTVLRQSLDKAWKLAHNHKDIGIAYRDSV